ncbi:MAG: cupredoxin domain-containing protein [Candidatus Limnocylindrales bacterium]
MSGRLGLLGGALVLGGALLVGAGAVVGGGVGSAGMMGGYGTGQGGGMMGGYGAAGAVSSGPGEAGFVAGTTSAPRVVRILATADLRFIPDTVRVQVGETIRFDVTTMGPTTHEFMVGPAADVAADTAGTPEIADLSMMQTGSVTYTFSGTGPFAYACHVTGHYEAGMRGTIDVVS